MAIDVSLIASGISAGGYILGSVLGGSAGAKHQKEANRIAREQLEFQKAQYNRWIGIWGDTEQSLANFARTYTGAHAQALGLRSVESQYKQLMPKLKEINAQRGLSSSGLGAHQEYQAELARHQQRAEVIADAPVEAAKVRAELFQSGAQREGALLQGRSNAANSAINTLTDARRRADSVGGERAGYFQEFLADGGANSLARRVSGAGKGTNLFANSLNKRGSAGYLGGGTRITTRAPKDIFRLD